MSSSCSIVCSIRQENTYLKRVPLRGSLQYFVVRAASDVYFGCKLGYDGVDMNYIFDFFGVIASELSSIWFAQHLPEYDSSELRQKYLNDADLGNCSLNELFDKLAILSHQSASDVTEQWFGLVAVHQDVVTIIEQLSQQHTVALCSNAPSEFIRPILKQYKLDGLFDEIVVSGEVGMIKPNEDIFIHTLDVLKVEPADTTFVDDTKENIETAIRMGMKTILFKETHDIASLLHT